MNTIYQLFARNVTLTPNKTAVYYQNEQVSYQSLMTSVDVFANSLASIGVKRGSTVTLFSGNNIEFVITLLAIAKLGAAVAPLPLTLKGHALATAIKQIDCQFAIAWQHTAKQIIDNKLLTAKQVVTMGHVVGNEYSFSELLANQELLAQEIEPAQLDDDFIYTMTSGSTGQPKPIVFSQATKVNRAFQATIEHYNLSPDDVILVATPMYHSLALRSILMPLMLGATAVILPKFTTQGWLQAIASQKVTFLFAVSSQLTALLPLLSNGDDYDLSSLKCVVSSSATLAPEDKTKLMAKFACQFHECYGASELGVVTNFDITQPEQVLESVGKPLPFVKVKVVDGNRNAVTRGDVGEIACQSSTRFKGYYNLPEKTANSIDELGYFYTGDLGFIDEQGFLHFVGRTSEVIKSGGINVYPKDIEQVMLQHEDIESCAAVAMSDEQFGEVIWLVYSTVSGEKLTQVDLMKLAMAELTDYQLPRKYIFMNALPQSALGKILKPEIKKILQTQ